MSISEILDLLPHRYPFVMIDRVLEYDLENKRLVALKNVTINEPFFVGHFPQYPVVPGVLLLEAMAQAAAVLAFKIRAESSGISKNVGEVCYFAGVDRARFKRPVVPGDQLILKVSIGKIRRDFFTSHVEATVNDELACIADLIAATKTTEG